MDFRGCSGRGLDSGFDSGGLADIQGLSNLPRRHARDPHGASPVELARPGQRPDDDGVEPSVSDERDNDGHGFDQGWPVPIPNRYVPL